VAGVTSLGIEQVNHAVTQMDQVVQSNAAQTEELSSTAQTLAGEARQLEELVRRFRVAAESPAPTPPPEARERRPKARPTFAPRANGGRAKVPQPARAATTRTEGAGGALDAGFEEF